jgi:autotransporter-associated beta strand protein
MTSISSAPPARRGPGVNGLARAVAAAALSLALALPAGAQSALWNPADPAGGSWGDPANGLGGAAPAGAGHTAGFVLDFTPAASVTLDGGRAIGTVISTSANPWTLDPGTGGTLTAASVIVTGGPLTVTAPLAGIDLAKDGSGTLTLSSPGSVYTGLIDVRAGTLRLVGSGNYSPGTNQVNVALGATLAVTALTSGTRFGGPGTRLGVNSGDTLTGTGTVGGGLRVRSGGTVYPGIAGVGALTVNGDGVFEAGSTWQVRLGSATVGGANTSNRIDLTGTLALADGANMVIDGAGLPFLPGQTYDYTIGTSRVPGFTTGAVNFQPANFDPSLPVSPADFALISSGDNLILRFTPLPEPAFAAAACPAWFVGYRLLRRASRQTIPAAAPAVRVFRGQPEDRRAGLA